MISSVLQKMINIMPMKLGHVCEGQSEWMEPLVYEHSGDIVLKPLIYLFFT